MFQWIRLQLRAALLRRYIAHYEEMAAAASRNIDYALRVYPDERRRAINAALQCRAELLAVNAQLQKDPE